MASTVVPILCGAHLYCAQRGSNKSNIIIASHNVYSNNIRFQSIQYTQFIYTYTYIYIYIYTQCLLQQYTIYLSQYNTPTIYIMFASHKTHVCASFLDPKRALQVLPLRAQVIQVAYVYICMYVYVSLSLSLSLSIYIYTCLHTYIYIYR